MPMKKFIDGIYLIDFEYHPLSGREGNPVVPVCMVVREWHSASTKRYWHTELRSMTEAPFPTGDNALCVAYFACAEMDCFNVLGWLIPKNLLDLYVEFRCLTNGLKTPHGNGLLGALLYFGLSTIGGDNKEKMRELILNRGPWGDEDQLKILDYCESDVLALGNLLDVMQELIDWPRALLRGQYMKVVSAIQINGISIDPKILSLLNDNWEHIKARLIEEVDRDYCVFEGLQFKKVLWERYLTDNDIPWPRLKSGQLDLSDNTFRDMALSYPLIGPIRELRAALSSLRLSSLQVGDDARNRCLLSPFKSTTGRNQPSTSKFIFGPSVWLRGLIKPPQGWGLAYIDWSQQEFGIAAALSEDTNMMSAYQSGDPYLAFAKQAGAAPAHATKHTHETVREQFKACVLAVQYGMGEESLALRINQPVARARQLLGLHRQTYRKFWKWSDSAVDEAVLNGRLWAGFGWQIHTAEDFNSRSLRNFPMQANGAEMLRIACILLHENGLRICAPVHDALLIEARLEELDAVVAKAQSLMQEASRITLNGFALSSDAKLIRYPDRYMDKRGKKMWDIVMNLIQEQTLENVQ